MPRLFFCTSETEELTEGRIQRSNLDGSEVQTLVSDLQDPGASCAKTKSVVDKYMNEAHIRSHKYMLMSTTTLQSMTATGEATVLHDTVFKIFWI